MRIQTRGNSTTVWLCSEAGVINGTMTLSVTPLEKILQAVNEKYGTSFESWSQLPTAYEVGDTVPNWNAYEKIEMPKRRVAAKMPSGGNASYLVGEIENSTFLVYAKATGGIISNNSGLVVADNGPAASAAQYIIGLFSQYGVTIDTVQDKMVDFEINTYIPNWSQYEIME